MLQARLWLDADEAVVREHYPHFAAEPPDALERPQHTRFADALEALADAGRFRFDIVQPSRGAITRTFVTRVLLGWLFERVFVNLS